MWQKIIKDRRMVGLLTLLLIVAAVPLTLYLGQQQQDVRQHAAEAPRICTLDQPTDTMMIFDQSGSMTKATSSTDSTPRMTRAKAASSAFLDILAKRTQTPLHEVSVTTISSEEKVKVVQTLTQNLINAKTAINNLTASGSTCIECAIGVIYGYWIKIKICSKCSKVLTDLLLYSLQMAVPSNTSADLSQDLLPIKHFLIKRR